MPKLSLLKIQLFIKFLIEMGCVERGEMTGSHKYFMRKDLLRPIVVVTSNKKISGFHIRNHLKVLKISE
jgi:predicted RNA binding protein YcfA (HicA-like mRNA interferase family)